MDIAARGGRAADRRAVNRRRVGNGDGRRKADVRLLRVYGVGAQRGETGAALTDWLCDGFGRALADPERFNATGDRKGVLSFMARRRTS